MASAPQNPRVFFDLTVGGRPAGRIEMELYTDVVPLTTENFRALCTGERGVGVNMKPLHYKGSVFHSIVPEYMWHGGDFVNGNSTGGESIYGNTFPDENFLIPHDNAGLLCMANGSADSNSSQFFICTKPVPWLDGYHVVFGRVISGFHNVKAIEGAVGSTMGGSNMGYGGSVEPPNFFGTNKLLLVLRLRQISRTEARVNANSIKKVHE
uniref:Peptidyl-prolyl cis-trans isomerase n=1 Tax=Oryza punctata TaxID=4537 RepID=A0A0E0LQ84_ORYPU